MVMQVPRLGVKYTRWGVQIHQNTGVFDLGTDTQKDTTAVDLFCGPQIHKIHNEFSPTPNTQNTDLTPRLGSSRRRSSTRSMRGLATSRVKRGRMRAGSAWARTSGKSLGLGFGPGTRWPRWQLSHKMPSRYACGHTESRAGAGSGGAAGAGAAAPDDVPPPANTRLNTPVDR